MPNKKRKAIQDPACPHCASAALSREVTIVDEQYLRRIDEDGTPHFDETVDTTPMWATALRCDGCGTDGIQMHEVVDA